MSATTMKKFFGEAQNGREYPPVTNSELIQFRKEDPEGYSEVSLACDKLYPDIKAEKV